MNRRLLFAAALAALPFINRPVRAQDGGAAALGELIRGLGVNTRVLVIAAHPDDEDTQLITWLARGRQVETAYLSLTRGDGHLMIETAAGFYGDEYNDAIRERLGTPSSTALYIEADDLAEFHSRLKAGGTVLIIDPLASRPWGQEEFTVEDPAGNWLTFWRRPDPA